MSPITRMLSLLLVGGFGFALPLLGQNLVQNGQFDGGLGRWVRFSSGNIEASWSARDTDGRADSGSLHLNEVGTTSDSNGGVAQCVPVNPANTYLVQAKIWADAQATAGTAGIGVSWYRSFDCGTGKISEVQKVITPTPGAWTVVSLPGLTPPADASHAVIGLGVVKPGAAGNYAVNFDDVAVLPTSATLTIPASASIHGAAGTFFHTDAWVINHSSTNTVTVTARHRCFSNQTCRAETQTFSLSPRESVLATDVIGSFFGDPESSGVIELVYDPTIAYISARTNTYTPSLPSPTYGTGIPALSSDAAQTRSLFLGLGSNGGDLSSGFRSNAGAYNPTPDPVTVTFTLYDRLGTVLGSPLTRTLGPYEPFQTNLFKDTGNAGVVTRDAYLVVTATAPVFAYVTVNDNQSGDQIFLRASEDHPPL